MDIAQKTIDFVPTENEDELGQQVGRWVLANAFMGLNPARGDYSHLADGIGRSAYLELGGYVRNPLHPNLNMSAGADVSFRLETQDLVIDPEGTYWRPGNYQCLVNWSSYGSSLFQIARVRAQFIEAGVQLAERFNDAFADKVVWHKVMTAQQHAERQAKNLRTKCWNAVIVAIKEAIHTTCRRMRVGDDRYITRQDWWVKGTYPIALENKEYEAEVLEHGLHFKRTK